MNTRLAFSNDQSNSTVDRDFHIKKKICVKNCGVHFSQFCLIHEILTINGNIMDESTTRYWESQVSLAVMLHVAVMSGH